MFLRFVSRDFREIFSSVIQPVKTVAVGVSVNNPIKNGCRCSFHKSFSHQLVYSIRTMRTMSLRKQKPEFLEEFLKGFPNLDCQKSMLNITRKSK